MENIIYTLKYNYKNYTETEKRIANYFVSANKNTSLKIQDVSKALFLSTSTISRFSKKIGFQNYKELVYEMTRSFSDNYEEQLYINETVKNIWEIHQAYFKKLYTTISSLDISFIVNKILNAKYIYLFGFGKLNELLAPITFRLEDTINHIKVIPHYEHFVYTLENVLTYENLIILFYENEQFENHLDEIILLAKKKFIPIVVLSLSKEIDNQKYAFSYTLCPFKDLSIPKHATTFYMPFFIFFDVIYLLISDKKTDIDSRIY